MPKSQLNAMSSNISWPAAVEYILVSFVPENELPLAPMRTFYATVVERLEICSKAQLFDALRFTKNPSKVLVMRTTLDDEEIENTFQELIENFAKSNVLYVLMLHKPEDELRILDIANILLTDSKFAVAAFSKTYAELSKRNNALSNQKKAQEIQNVSKQLLYDIVRVIMKRKSDVNEKVDDSFIGGNDLFSDEDDQETVVSNIRSASVPNSASSKVQVQHASNSASSMVQHQQTPTLALFQHQNVSNSVSSAVHQASNPNLVVYDPNLNANPMPVSSGISNNTRVPGRKSIQIDVVPSFKQLGLSPGNLYDVVVSHVTDKAEFYVQFCAHCKFLEYLTFRMNLHYAILDDKETMLSYEKVRQSADITEIWCAAPYAFDSLAPNGKQCYFRAKLLSRVSTVNYEVQFFDYGNVARVPFSILKTLPESFRPVGGLAVHCRLKEQGIDWRLLRQKVESSAPGSWCVLRIDNMDSTPYLATLLLTDGYNEENVGEALLREQQQRKASPDSGLNNLNNLSAGRGRRNLSSRS